jgi:S1-C subfamily serine protease
MVSSERGSSGRRDPVRKMVIGLACCFAAVCAAQIGFPQSTQGSLSGEEIVSRVSPSVVVILVGRGAGRIQAEGSGVVIKSDGIVLTAWHLIKDAQEVQVRLKSGDVYDRVDLVSYDARRDIAALKIAASGLAELAMAPPDGIAVGETVYTISNPNGLAWSASSGVLSASRLAEEVPGAGSGYRILQFTAPVSPGSSGGALVDGHGQLLGIITASQSGENVNFAVPAASVAGLAEMKERTPLGSGAALEPPARTPSPTRAALSGANPTELFKSARTICIRSKTTWFTADVLAKEIAKRAGKDLGLLIVEDPKLADLILLVDRPIFTYDFTYTVTSPSTGIILASGKVTAVDGVRAAPGIAKKFLEQLKEAREAQPPNAAKKE